MKIVGDDLFDQDAEVKMTIDTFDATLAEIVARYGQEVLSEILGTDVTFEQTHTVTDYLRKKVIRLAGEVTDTTIEKIRDTLTAGQEDGDSVVQLRDRVKQVFTDAENYRAEAIARTETTASANFGNHEGMVQSGVVTQKEWLSIMDANVRDGHAAADGQTVDLNVPYKVEGEELMYPGDPIGSAGNIINCRCVSVPAGFAG